MVTSLSRLDPQTVMGSVKAGAPVNAGGYILLPKELQVDIEDIPLYQQYWEWLSNSCRPEFGNSLKGDGHRNDPGWPIRFRRPQRRGHFES